MSDTTPAAGELWAEYCVDELCQVHRLFLIDRLKVDRRGVTWVWILNTKTGRSEKLESLFHFRNFAAHGVFKRV